jgi:hypothetical protein
MFKLYHGHDKITITCFKSVVYNVQAISRPMYNKQMEFKIKTFITVSVQCVGVDKHVYVGPIVSAL